MKRLTWELAQKTASGFSLAGFDLRVAGEDDIADILALGRAVFSYNPPTKRELRYAITKAHGAIFVLRARDGALAGYAAYEAHMGYQGLYLNMVAVAPEFRGKGLAQALYRFGDALAAAIDARVMLCHVKPDNAANLHVLEKAGFCRQRVEQQYYDDGSSAYVYRKNYSPA